MLAHCFKIASLLLPLLALQAIAEEPPSKSAVKTAPTSPATPAPISPVYGPADPLVRDLKRFDARRPVVQELQTDVPDGFTVGAVGDLIISRPLSQYSQRLPGFKDVLGVLRGNDVLYGNL